MKEKKSQDDLEEAVDSVWGEFELVTDPASGKRLPNEGHAQGLKGYDFDG